MHPPPPFDPAVTVSALALQNLTNLPFTRYTIAQPPPPNPVAQRARWLEPGVGQSVALPAAALSLLAEQLPSALATVLRPTPKNARASVLYVFGTHATLDAVADLLRDAFTSEQVQQWTPESPPVVTRALTAAIHRAIFHALEPSGAIRVGSDLLLPDSNLTYSFTVSLGRGKNPGFLIRVAVKHTSARRITDEDCASALQAPLSVIAAPMGIRATLSPRALAGDALTASVLKRWREAGLLPASDLSDSTVVFLSINGVDVPFPRLVVLTSQPSSANDPIKPTDKPLPKKPSNTNTNLWRSRKRPRSPPATEELNNDNCIPKSESEKATVPPIGTQLHDAPTAASFNAALEAIGVTGDPAPTLHHPLVEPIAPPTFHQDPSSAKQGPQEHKSSPKETNGEPPDAQKNESNFAKKQAELETIDVVKAEPVTQQMQSSNGLDAFLLDGDGNTQDGFDTGQGMDMTDFSAFDDDVTEFFRDGMDDRIPEVDNDNNLLDSDESNRAAAQNNQGKSASKNGLSDNGPADPDSVNLTEDTKMDVDVKPNAADSEKGANDAVQGPSQVPSFSAVDVVNVALSALRRPIPTCRPKKDAVRTQLYSFFEEDLTDRRSVRLGASRTIGKRKGRGKSRVRIAPIQIRAIESQMVDKLAPVSSNVLDSKSILVSPESGRYNRRELLYVPRRKVRAYSKLRRKGVHVTTTTILADDSQYDSDSTDDDEGDTSNHKPDIRPNKNADYFLSMDVPRDVISRSPKAPTKNDLGSGHRDELDSLKVADGVAVDCQSACMVLAAGSDLHASSTSFVGHTNGMRGAQDTSGSPPTSREDDGKTGQPLALSQSVSKASIQASHGKAPSGSPITRQPGKRDRELFALLSLLEMQLFAMNELSIFPDTETSGSLTAKKDRATTGLEPEHVSSATMRRVLLGLPRALETSHCLSSCIASFTEEGQHQAMLSVKGPLSVNDFLGGSATVFPLSSPRVCVGFNNEWIEESSGALPLWEKAGFEPYSNKKNIEYVAVAPKDIDEDVKLFLRDVSAAYEECSFGKHIAMPFDAVTLITNSVSRSNSTEKPRAAGALSEAEKSMAEQYHLAVTGLCTKLAAVTRDHRKNPTGSATNIVAYIVSPFSRGSKAANVALMRAVAPLVSAVPGTVPSMVGTVAPGPNLPSAPWRSSPSSKNVVSVTVRIIPREVVERKLSGRVDVASLLRRPLRPQLMKAVSFAVFNSIRSKRVRVPSVDGEVSTLLSRASLMPDELMSPMTPDIIAESPGANGATPVSPVGPTSEDSVHGSAPAMHSASLLDQSSALSPSFLHEPVVVLAGVGSHMAQTDSRPNIVLHLAYAFCEGSSRYVFTWTDQRGEMLDVASVPVSKAALSSSRRKAFWGMWARGQRWRISYVDEVHATVAKLGAMVAGETEDWDWVINKVTSSASGQTEKKADGNSSKGLVRRFPPPPQSRGEDISDSYTDVPTPAAHTLPPSVTGNGAKSPISMDVKMPAMASISLLSVCSAESHLFMEKSDDKSTDRRDFAVVSDTSLLKGKNVQANAILARFEDDGINAIEINVLRHYGNAEEGEEMSDDRSPWDCFDVQGIVNTIAVNFHELRYVASPPSWPHKRWLSLYPVHLDAVRGFKTNLKHVHNLAFLNHTSSTR